jgi:hypothetical protein
MSKKKRKKKKKKGFFESIRPFISDDRVLQAIFGAASAGISWVAAIKARQDAKAVEKKADDTTDMLKNTTPPKAKAK